MVRVLSPYTGNNRCVGRLLAGLSFTLALLVAGCASVPPPDNAMNQAQSQLQAARDAQAQDYAPVDLGFAQDKFQQAQAAMADRKYAVAAQLAAESQADAELAAAKGRLGAARAEIQRKADQNNRLRAQGATASASGDSRSTTYDDAPVVPADMGQGNFPAPAASGMSAPAMRGGFQNVPPPPASAVSSGSSASGGFQNLPAPAQSILPPARPMSPAAAFEGGRT